VHLIARGSDWTVGEYTCYAGPQDRPFEEWHSGVSIAAVVAGTFNYRTDTGRALMHPGSFLLGNSGACFECSHDHGMGDRCIFIHLAPELFAEIATTDGKSSRYRFDNPILPATERTMSAIARLETIGQSRESLAVEEVMAALVATVLSIASGPVATTIHVTTRVERRIAEVVRYMDERVTDPHSLATLAAAAGLSRFHFLRTFRHTIGMSPHQYLLVLRMQRVATRLIETADAVSAIAFDAGFNDLSTFNRRFRRLFGVNPLEYRARAK
jgi:AraC family transcriptional regulator